MEQGGLRDNKFNHIILKRAKNVHSFIKLRYFKFKFYESGFTALKAEFCIEIAESGVLEAFCFVFHLSKYCVLFSICQNI